MIKDIINNIKITDDLPTYGHMLKLIVMLKYGDVH